MNAAQRRESILKRLSGAEAPVSASALAALLGVSRQIDVDNFIQQAKDTPEALLSRMTGGVHLHTLHCPDAGSFERIRQALDEKGILYRKE